MKATWKIAAIFAVFVILAVTACDDGEDDTGGTVQKTDAVRPTITVEPVGGAYLPGATVTPLSVTASVSDGGTLSYQWYSRTSSFAAGTAIGEAINENFTPTVSTPGTVYYYVEVTNTNNSVDGTKTAVQTSRNAKIVTGWESVDVLDIELVTVNGNSYMFSPKSIIFANNLFVAVGGFAASPGQIGWSNDGKIWKLVENTTFGNSIINGIAYGNNRFIAVGDDGKMASSADGKTWTSVDVSSAFGTSNINDVAYGNNRFFAVGDDSKTAYLTNSDSTWTGASANPASLRRIVYGANTFTAYGTHPSVANRVNCNFYNSSTSWTLMGGMGVMILDLISTGTNLVEVGANGNVWIQSSSTNWTEIKPLSIMGTDTITNAAYGSGKLLVFSTNKGAWSDDDGETWTEVPYVNMSRMVYGAGRFVAVAGGSGIYYADYQ
jgi:hypothetical protein